MPNPWSVGVALLLLTVPVAAADWQATRLVGQVEQLVGEQWLPLKRGDIVPDGRQVRTLAGGRVELTRETDVISLAPATAVAISESTAEPFTTVTQAYGTVEAEVTVQPFEHFEVRTPLLAAVVKGTHFIVQSTSATASVRVTRGTVAVEALETGRTTLVHADEVASLRRGNALELTTTAPASAPALAGDAGTIVATDNPARQLSAVVADVGSLPAASAAAASALPSAGNGTLQLAAPSMADPSQGSGVADLMLSYDRPLGGTLKRVDKDADSMFGPLLGAAILCGGILLGAIAILFRRIFG
jgi:hypothetical protein